MKVGDLVQMVTGQPDYKSDPRNNGILVDLHMIAPTSDRTRRVATVMSFAGEIMTWPLDSHYEIKVINESR
jgi:hypothetical protein